MERCGEHELKGQAVAAVWRNSAGLQKKYLLARELGLTTQVVFIDKRKIDNEKRHKTGLG
jgi:hypothetical protein